MNELERALAIGQNLGSAAPILELSRYEDFATRLSFYLFAGALIFCALFVVGYVAPIRWTLWRKRRVVRAAADYTDWARRVDYLEGEFVKSHFLRHAWQGFREALIARIGSDRDYSIIENRKRAHEYFNLKGAGFALRCWGLLANVFLTFGLLLTLFAFLSTWHLSVSIGRSDFEHTRVSLQDALEAASFNFYRLGAGLVASILFGFVVRWGINSIAKGLNKLSDALEWRFTAVAPAYQVEALKQNERLESFTGNIAFSVGQYIEEALNKTLSSRLAAAMEPVATKLAEVTAAVTKVDKDTRSSTVDEVRDRLEGTVGDQVNAIAQVLAELGGTLDGISAKMNSSGDELARKMRQSIDEIKSEVAQIVGAVSELNARIDCEASEAHRAAEGQLAVTRQVMEEIGAKLLDHLQTSASRMVNGFEKAAQSFALQMETARQSLEKLTVEIGSARERAVAGGERSAPKATADDIAESFGQAVGSLKAIVYGK